MSEIKMPRLGKIAAALACCACVAAAAANGYASGRLLRAASYS
jgi:F0F1-type ATP synthase membrane subunit c/vacuolar-type H+-ATPase subunit K